MPRKASKKPALAVVRMHEATGTSARSWDAAILAAIAQAKKDVSGKIIGFEVVRLAGDSAGGRIAGRRATVRVAYRERVVAP